MTPRSVAALASSFPDYSGLEPIVTAVMVAIVVGMVFTFVRLYRRTPPAARPSGDAGERVPGAGRRVAIAVGIWVALAALAWLLVTAFS